MYIGGFCPLLQNYLLVLTLPPDRFVCLRHPQKTSSSHISFHSISWDAYFHQGKYYLPFLQWRILINETDCCQFWQSSYQDLFHPLTGESGCKSSSLSSNLLIQHARTVIFPSLGSCHSNEFWIAVVTKVCLFFLLKRIPY